MGGVVTKICPDCRGGNIEEEVVFWMDANGPDDSTMKSGPWRTGQFFCADCECNIDGVIEKEE